jgi:hypothetical protein
MHCKREIGYKQYDDFNLCPFHSPQKQLLIIVAVKFSFILIQIGYNKNRVSPKELGFVFGNLWFLV